MKNTLLVILVLLFYVQFSNAQYYELKITPVLGENKQSPGGTFAIAEDKQGFIWLGSLNGLIRYDGYQFKYFKYNKNDSNTISNNTIRALYVDNEGVIWIGTQGGGLNRFDPKTEIFTHYFNDPKRNNSLSNNDVWAITEDQKGFLWIGTWGGGLNRLDKKTGVFTRFQHKENANSISDDIIRTIKVDQDGMIWIGTYSLGLNKMDPKTMHFTNFKNSPNDAGSLGNNENYSLYIDQANSVWVCTLKNGISQYDRKGNHFIRYLHDPKNANSLNDNSVYAITKSKKNKFWIGLQEQGINTYDPQLNVFKSFKHDKSNPNSLSSDRIRCVFEDSNGIIWVGSESGVDKIVERDNFLLYRPKVNDVTIVRSIYEDKDRLLWIGMYRGALICFDKKTNQYVKDTKIPQIPELNEIKAMAEDDENNFWVGTNQGVFVFDQNRKIKKRFSVVDSKKNCISDNTVQIIKNAHNGEMWVGTENGLNRYDQKTEQWTSFMNDPNNPNSISSNKIQPCALIVEKDGTVWAGTWAGGLNKYIPQKKGFKRYLNGQKNRNSISSNNVISLYETADGIIWIGTFGGGLNRLDPKTENFKGYTENEGLSSNTVYCILGDKEGNLWLSTENGLSKFDPKTEKFLNFDAKDGLQSNEFYWGAGFQSKTGEMYFGGIDGLNSFYPENIKLNPHIPTVKFTDIRKFNISVKLPNSINHIDKLVFSHNETNLRIDFVAMDFIEPQKNQFTYKLVGLDENWIKNGNLNSINFTNIPPGTYTLLVKASNNDGIWNESPVSIQIVILPPWWATWWFRTLMFVVVVGGSLSFYFYRVSALKRRQKILEKKVAERTRDLQNANGMLQKQQFEIVQQNQEIKQQAEELLVQRDVISETLKKVNDQHEHIKGSIRYAQTIQRAILPSEDLLFTKLNCFVIYRPKDIVSGDFYWFYELEKPDGDAKIGKALIATVDCTGHGVPGAFMSMIGSRLLSEIVIEQGISDPAHILDALSIGVYHSLNQGESANEDGMDLSICLLECVENGNMKVTFAGAKTAILCFHQSGNEIMRYKGDHKNIGGSKLRSQAEGFKNTEIMLASGDSFYLLTDGYVDQNNRERARYGSKRLEQLLSTVAQLPIIEQKAAIESDLENWQGREQQRDDITFLGMKIQ